MILTAEQEQFIRDNYQSMTNPQLAEALGLRLTSMRTAMYKLGLKRMEMEYWNEEMTNFLIENYAIMGDYEIAEHFQIHFPKNKPWKYNHIAKKRGYLNLNRSIAQIAAINDRNALRGCFIKNHWKLKPENNYPIGHIKPYRGKMIIKNEDGLFVPYAPVLYRQHFGEVPPKHSVTFKDGDPLNCVPENLIAKTKNQICWEARRLKKEKTTIATKKRFIPMELKPSHQEKVMKKMIHATKPVRIDAKTTIWIDKDKDPEQAKREWMAKRSKLVFDQKEEMINRLPVNNR